MTAFRPGQSPPPVRTPTRIQISFRSYWLDYDSASIAGDCSPVRLVPMSVLAIDAGTTGVTALIVTADGRVASRGYSEFSQYFPEPGWVEQLPGGIWDATLSACRQALAAQSDAQAAADPVTC